MTYGFIVDAPVPAEVYDAVHAEVVRRAGDRVDGMLVHVAWATGAGFRVLEVWESKELCDRFEAAVVGPAMAQVAAGQPAEGPEPAREEFEPRGLILAGMPAPPRPMTQA